MGWLEASFFPYFSDPRITELLCIGCDLHAKDAGDQSWQEIFRSCGVPRPAKLTKLVDTDGHSCFWSTNALIKCCELMWLGIVFIQRNSLSVFFSCVGCKWCSNPYENTSIVFEDVPLWRFPSRPQTSLTLNWCLRFRMLPTYEDLSGSQVCQFVKLIQCQMVIWKKRMRLFLNMEIMECPCFYFHCADK